MNVRFVISAPSNSRAQGVGEIGAQYSPLLTSFINKHIVKQHLNTISWVVSQPCLS